MNNYISTPATGFVDAVRSTLNNLTNFNGRTRRSEFWWSVLAYQVAIFIFNLMFSFIMPQSFYLILSEALHFLLFATTVRRLHDTGRNGWWVGASWIASIALSIYMIMNGNVLSSINTNIEELMEFASSPVVMALGFAQTVLTIVVVVFCILDGKAEPNKYGESPKYKSAGE